MMQSLWRILGAGALLFSTASADEASRFSSPLPEVLLTQEGAKVTRPDQWPARRREIVDLLADTIYGRSPSIRPDDLRFQATEDDGAALDGTAVSRKVAILFSGRGGEGRMTLSLFIPNGQAKPKGIFVLIVNRGRAIIEDANSTPTEFWPVREIVARGYVAAAFHNSDLATDAKAESWTGGVFKIFGPTLAERKPDDWGTIAAWAWGASRAIDYLKSDATLASLPVAVVGHSRGSKAALWCGAQDERVSLTISNDSGCTGAALARRTRGETIQKINTTFPHWFCGNYKTFNGRESELPVDQHMLIAAMAPRLVYVASASEDANADPAAEFAACVAAEPAFDLFGMSSSLGSALPVPGVALHDGPIGYHLRAGKHDLKASDWKNFMDFADRHPGELRRQR